MGNIGDPQACEGCSPTGGTTTTAEVPIEASRFPRLSHRQWENTVKDLLHLPQEPGLSASFTGDPLGGVFDNNESSLLVTPGLWADYQLAAEDLAAGITGDPALLAAILPPDPPADPAARARAFIEGFGRRAYRRPLSPAEVDAYAALFAKAPALVDGPDDFTKGVRLVLHAFLQSPHFVYRVERSSEVKDGAIPLDGWELATKLSYMLWNTMPDDALFDAAASGKLATPEGVLAEAQRMLDDDRARPVVGYFHEQLFDYDHYQDLTKDPTLFPDFTPDQGDDMQKEAELFIDDVVFSENGGVSEILTEPFTYVNDRLAKLYGLGGQYGPEFVRAELDPATRSGFLTHIGFLASNATPREQHSIHRGVFINLRVLCADLPPPPNNVPSLPPASGYPTNRARVEAHTGAGTCGETCHGTLINPVGFAFEHYDAMGQYKTVENGNPIDSSDQYDLDGTTIQYADAIELDELIAESEAVHRCYAKHWLEYGYGRRVQDGDEPSLADLAARSREGTKALVLALTQTKAFRTRAPVKETP